VELEGGRGRGSGERQEGRWTSSRSIWGIFGQRTCACVLFLRESGCVDEDELYLDGVAAPGPPLSFFSLIFDEVTYLAQKLS
jgi:hypothetical protein